MNIPKPVATITPILLLLFLTGCSKGLLPRDADSDSRLFGMDSSLEQVDPYSSGAASSLSADEQPGLTRNFGSAESGMPGDGSTGSFSAEPFDTDGDSNAAASIRPHESPGTGQDFGSAESGMPGDGSTGSFSAEPFDADAGEPGTNVLSENSDATLQPGSIREESPDEVASLTDPYDPSGPGRDFGSAELGMPGDGSTGSFSAEPFDADAGEPGTGALSENGDAAGSIRQESPDGVVSLTDPYDPSGPGRDFGSAESGMPGDGSTGSFSAEPFAADAGEPGTGALSENGDAALQPGSIREESLDEVASLTDPYDPPGPGREFGSAEFGMPGDGSTGSFSAEPFAEVEVAPLPREEAVRRLLPYRSLDNLQDIHFAFDKHDLDDESRAILQKNAAYLRSFPVYKIEIEGHCDERGSNSYNVSLGERRAQSAKSYLVFLGVDENRIRTISYGEERPFCLESNEICWYQNRRAHFLVAE